MTKRFCDNEIWQKDWFLELTIKQKLLMKFLFDNCDCAGFYEISYRTLKNCFNEEIVKTDFENLKQIRFINDNTIFIEDFITFQCGISSIDKLNPNNNAHKGIIKRLEKYNLIKKNLGASEPLVSPSLGAQEKEKEKEKEEYISSSLVLSSSLNEKIEIESNNHSKRFQKPTIEEIKAYCETRRNSVDAVRFYDFYESKGWLVGKTKMRDWQAAIRTWEHNTNGKTEIESGNRECLQDSTVITAQYAKIAEKAAKNPLDLESVKKKLLFAPKKTKQRITNTSEENKK